ncbi:MAG: hypothetical protein RLZZ336_1134, partial [Cyanobacteriota bacterium]
MVRWRSSGDLWLLDPLAQPPSPHQPPPLLEFIGGSYLSAT